MINTGTRTLLIPSPLSAEPLGQNPPSPPEADNRKGSQC